jgi:hypothetical protein
VHLQRNQQGMEDWKPPEDDNIPSFLRDRLTMVSQVILHPNESPTHPDCWQWPSQKKMPQCIDRKQIAMRFSADGESWTDLLGGFHWLSEQTPVGMERKGTILVSKNSYQPPKGATDTGIAPDNSGEEWNDAVSRMSANWGHATGRRGTSYDKVFFDFCKLIEWPCTAKNFRYADEDKNEPSCRITSFLHVASRIENWGERGDLPRKGYPTPTDVFKLAYDYDEKYGERVVTLKGGSTITIVGKVARYNIQKLYDNSTMGDLARYFLVEYLSDMTRDNREGAWDIISGMMFTIWWAMDDLLFFVKQTSWWSLDRSILIHRREMTTDQFGYLPILDYAKDPDRVYLETEKVRDALRDESLNWISLAKKCVTHMMRKADDDTRRAERDKALNLKQLRDGHLYPKVNTNISKNRRRVNTNPREKGNRNK